MLNEPDSLNVLVDRGEHKGYIIQVNQVRFCSRFGIVFVDSDANMHNGRGRSGYILRLVRERPIYLVNDGG